MDENQQPVQAANPPQQPLEPQSVQPGQKKKRSKLLYILLILLITVFLGLGYFFIKLQKNSNSNLSPKTNPSTSKMKPLPDTKNDTELTGKMQLLSDDLELIIQTQSDKTNKIKPVITYYDAGTFTKGVYNGYKRYVVIRSTRDPGGPGIYIFATEDNKKYILDGDPNDPELQPRSGYDPLEEINKSKLEKIAHLGSIHAININLDSKFALNRNKILTESVETGTKDSFGNTNHKDILITDFSSYSTFVSPNRLMQIYAGRKPDLYHDPTLTPAPTLEDKYIDGTTQIIVVDSTGLAYSYDLTNFQQASEYPQKLKTYNKKVAELQSSKQNALPYPEYPNRPNLRLTKSDIQSSVSLYNKYDIAFPQGCATDVNTLVVKNISDQDVQKIGTSPYGDLFIFSNKNHPMIKAEFDKKIASYDQSKDLFEQVNKRKQPSFEEYINKNPLIVFKDHWGRWVILGEFDFLLGGGCGKPVIYLYPTIPTEVSVKFITPIKFDITIPEYKNGWNVLAQPDGTLMDLQSQFTNCDKIDSSKKGSEYALDACNKNNYPYLYWAGRSTEKPYPKISKGWIVEQNNLSEFLNQKLDEVGFNQKEKNDFLEYWLPELQNKNSPYYRISFLQTQEMNSIAPMQIIPQPKNVFRLFMDYLPLKYKPSTIEPQTLSKVVRDGFTVVEWGGLKK